MVTFVQCFGGGRSQWDAKPGTLMQKFLTNLLLLLAILGALLFFSPLSSMLDFWEPVSPDTSVPVVEESAAEESSAPEVDEEIDVDHADPVIEDVADTNTDEASAPEAGEPEDGGMEAESEELPDGAEATETVDELVDPETEN